LQFLGSLLAHQVPGSGMRTDGRAKRRRRLTAPQGKERKYEYRTRLPPGGAARLFRTCTSAAVLVINCGSSSLNSSFYDTADESRHARGLVACIGLGGTGLAHRGPKAGTALGGSLQLACAGRTTPRPGLPS
jgi:hypothetical protein